MNFEKYHSHYEDFTLYLQLFGLNKLCLPDKNVVHWGLNNSYRINGCYFVTIIVILYVCEVNMNKHFVKNILVVCI
jgi:hypothetical protein